MNYFLSSGGCGLYGWLLEKERGGALCWIAEEVGIECDRGLQLDCGSIKKEEEEIIRF